MTRVVIGMTMVWVMTMTPALADTGKPEIKTSRQRDGATVTLQAGPLTVMQTLTTTGVNLRLVLADDVLDFSADLAGNVSVARGDVRWGFSVRTATADDQAALRRALANSAAIDAFDALLASAWAQSAEPAVIFRSTREVLRVLQGDHRSIESLVAVRTAPNASIVRVRQRLSPSQCWETYNKDVVYFTYELQSCLSSVSSQWWNPFATAWCAYEYNLKSSLSAIWLLDCYGVGV
jgi:hypothetical protein